MTMCHNHVLLTHDTSHCEFTGINRVKGRWYTHKHTHTDTPEIKLQSAVARAWQRNGQVEQLSYRLWDSFCPTNIS